MMNQKKFLQNYNPVVEHDLTATELPLSWAPGHPKQWGQEKAAIRLGQETKCTPALSPDDELLAVGLGEEIHLYKVSTQELVQVLKGQGQDVAKVQFSSLTSGTADKGYYLASESQITSDQDEDTPIVVLWQLDSHGKLLSSDIKPAGDKASTEARANLRFDGELGFFGSAAFSRDGKALLFLSHNQTTQNDEDDGMTRDDASLPCVNVWSLESGALLQLRGHTDAVQWVGTSPDSRQVASISWDGTARVWDATSGACLRVLGPFGGQLWSGAFSPDGRYLAFSQGDPDCLVHVCELSTGRAVSRFDGLHARAFSLAWSPDGTMLACGADKGTLAVWDPYTGEERMRWNLAFDDMLMSFLALVRGVRFLNDRKIIFQICEGTVYVYDLETKVKQQFTWPAEEKPEKFPRAEIVCSAQLIVVPDTKGVLRLWDL